MLTASRTLKTLQPLDQELHEFGVDLLRARPGYAVRTTVDLHVLDALDHLCLSPGRGVRRQNAVVVAMYDHGRYVVAGDVLAKVLDPGIDARQGADGGSADRNIPIGFDHALADPLSVSSA